MRKKLVGSIAIVAGSIFAGVVVSGIMDVSDFPELFEGLVFFIIGLLMLGGLFELWKN